MTSKVYARLLALALLAPRPAVAEGSPEERARAKELIAQGARSYEANEYARAAGEFRQAYELFHSPKIFFNIAQAELKAKHPDAAADAFAQFLTQTALDTKLDTAKVAEAKKELAGLRKKLAWTTLSVEPEAARLAVDGRPVLPGEVYLTPGKHLLTAAADGYQAATREVTAAGPGKVANVTLELKPQPKVAIIAPPPEKPAEPQGGATQAVKPPAPAPAPAKEVPLVRPAEEAAKPAPPAPAPKPAEAAGEGGTRTLLASAEPDPKAAAGGLTVDKPAASGGVGHLPAYVAWGVAVASAGAAVGTGFYSLSLSSRAKNAEACAGDAYAGCYKTWKRTALTTDVLWGVAGAAAVTGGVLFFVTPGADGAGGEVGVRGSF